MKILPQHDSHNPQYSDWISIDHFDLRSSFRKSKRNFSQSSRGPVNEITSNLIATGSIPVTRANSAFSWKSKLRVSLRSSQRIYLRWHPSIRGTRVEHVINRRHRVTSSNTISNKRYKRNRLLNNRKLDRYLFRRISIYVLKSSQVQIRFKSSTDRNITYSKQGKTIESNKSPTFQRFLDIQWCSWDGCQVSHRRSSSR